MTVTPQKICSLLECFHMYFTVLVRSDSSQLRHRFIVLIKDCRRRYLAERYFGAFFSVRGNAYLEYKCDLTCVTSTNPKPRSGILNPQ